MSLAAVALAAGRGERLRPLTDERPKVLLPVGGVPLLDLALERLGSCVATELSTTAVNAHYRAAQVVERVGDRAHVSVEPEVALGTAGALGALREWLDGRDVLLTNGDVHQSGGLDALVDGWDGDRCRLLVGDAGPLRVDFRTPDGRDVRYLGSCLLPWQLVESLLPERSGLYEVLWRGLDAAGALDLVPWSGVSIDCGTPADYLAANLQASGGRSVVGSGAVVEGVVERSVVWDGAYVGPHERLRDVVRAGTRERPVTVPATVGG